jgi:hypothetical protein
MGLQMKMKRGELVGFNGCFGYDYADCVLLICPFTPLRAV